MMTVFVLSLIAISEIRDKKSGASCVLVDMDKTTNLRERMAVIDIRDCENGSPSKAT